MAAAAAAAAAVDEGAADTAANSADGGTGAEGSGAKAWCSAEPLDGVPGLDLGDEADDLALGEVLPPGGDDGAMEVGVTGADEDGGRPRWGPGGGNAPPAAAAAAICWACARARAGCNPCKK